MYFLKPLSTEDEAILLKQYFEGEPKEQEVAKNKLIEHNLRLVAHFAKRYYDSSVENFYYDYEELISIGIIGLIKGINTYSVDKKTKLSTYAGRCIENELRMHLRVKKKYTSDVSINEPQNIDFEGNEVTLLDKLVDEKTDVEEDVHTKIQIEMLMKNFDKVLDEREKHIIIKRYGLKCREYTQKEIAKELDVSRSYVSRIEKKALEKLRKSLC
ncbi:MAG: sigma-70 family RNA polymerase sigma factor [Lachnospirales bacterium]